MSATTAREPEAIDAWLVAWFAPRPVFEVWSRSVDAVLEASLATQDTLLEVWRPYAEQADRAAQTLDAQLRYSALELLEQLDQARAARERAQRERQRQAERAKRDLARERHRTERQVARRQRAEQERDQARAQAEEAAATCQRLERDLARERERAARAEEGQAKAEAELRLSAPAARPANHVSAAGRRKPRSNTA